MATDSERLVAYISKLFAYSTLRVTIREFMPILFLSDALEIAIARAWALS